MESGHAHPGDGGQFLYPNRLGEAAAQGVNRGSHLPRMAAAQGQSQRLRGMRAGQEPVADLTHRGRVQHRDCLRHVQQLYEAKDAFRKRAVEVRQVHSLHGRTARVRRILHGVEYFPHEGWVEFEHDAEVRLGWTCFRDIAQPRHLHADQQRLSGAVLDPLFAEDCPFRPLHDDAQRRLVHQKGRVLRVVGPEQGQALDPGRKRARAGLRAGPPQQGFDERVRHAFLSTILRAASRNRQESGVFGYSHP